MPYETHSEIRIVQGDSFLISDAFGNINCDGINLQGLFFRDTRFLSRCDILLNDEELHLLSANEETPFLASYYSTMPYKSLFDSHPITLIRHRAVGNGLIEEIILQNYVNNPIDITLQISFDADFIDVMEARSGLKAKSKSSFIINHKQHQLIFEYQIEDLIRKSMIHLEPGAIINNKEVTFKATVPPKGEWKTFFTISPVWQDIIISPELFFAHPRPDLHQEAPGSNALKKWLELTPKIQCNYTPFCNLFKKSINEIDALKIYTGFLENPGIAAGMPWYQTVFGRDSIIAAYQYSYISPEKGIDVLKSLAKLQGKEYNDYQDEEPGKIMHELRFGEATLLGDLPYMPYYGTADATPLYLILLYEIYSWTGKKDIVNELKEPALKALNWIDHYGDMDNDGYVEYKRRSFKGLNNHCWKDSDISIIFSDGTIAEPPIASAEIQGYVYDAKLKLAFLAEKIWGDFALATKLRNEAANLKERFNIDFWIDEKGGYFALALDKNKKKVDSITSNMGQLLWSGIVNDDKAALIAKQLVCDGLYSGWGIRTMSSKEVGYNPLEYHNGSVWPHDNSLIAFGLARYGYRNEANKIIIDLIKASRFFDNRLPEVFAGYKKIEATDFPIIYPNASFPQAWASGASMLFLRTILGLEPDLKNCSLKLDPYLPQELKYIYIDNILLFGKRFSIEIDNNNVSLKELK